MNQEVKKAKQKCSEIKEEAKLESSQKNYRFNIDNIYIQGKTLFLQGLLLLTQASCALLLCFIYMGFCILAMDSNQYSIM